MKTGTAGLDLIKSFEGYHTRLSDGSCKAYLDKLVRPELRSPGYAGLWTIGWGNTGPNVTEGTTWSRSRAESELRKMVARHEKAVEDAVHVPVTQNQFDALVSLSYNMGIHKAQTLLKKLNAEDYEGAADAFLLYNKAGGKVVSGLVRRRKTERELFLQKKVRSTPPAVEQSSKLTVLQRIRNAVAGLGITGAAITQLFQDVGTWIQQNSGLALIISGVSIWLLLKWIEHKSIEDYRDGRYIPSGARANDDDDDDDESA